MRGEPETLRLLSTRKLLFLPAVNPDGCRYSLRVSMLAALCRLAYSNKIIHISILSSYKCVHARNIAFTQVRVEQPRAPARRRYEA